MRLLVTAEQMREIDRTAIEDFSIPGLVLMENAGRAFVDALATRAGPLDGAKVVVVAGKGNNGGDGFVIARHLLNRGCIVTVLLQGSPRDLRGETLVNYTTLLRLTRRTKAPLTVRHGRSASAFRGIGPFAIVVDALFGTGFSGSVRGISARGVRWMNDRDSFRASVDIASGVDASTGEVSGNAVRAHLTVTMGCAKVGQFIGVGREHSGEVVVADISIPRGAIRAPRDPVWIVENADVRTKLPSRPRTAHKYSVGKVLVIGGSRSFTGAPALCASAALRSGTGAVILAVPRSIHPIMARKLQEVIVLPLEETVEGTIATEAIDDLQEKCSWADAVALGPGLGRNSRTDGLVSALLASCRKPVVVDADAITAVAASPRVLTGRRNNTILTPHAGELSRLTGETGTTIEARRVLAARAAARRFRSVVVLKGSPTATATPEGAVFLNPTGNPGMATIGSGDVLTGIVAGLVAQGLSPLNAATAGVYLHGQAGDLAAARFGERSLVASDILEAVPRAILACEAL